MLIQHSAYGYYAGKNGQYFYYKISENPEIYMHTLFTDAKYKSFLYENILPKKVVESIEEFYLAYGPCSLFEYLTIYSYNDQIDREAIFPELQPIPIPIFMTGPLDILGNKDFYLFGSFCGYSKYADIYVDLSSGSTIFIYENCISEPYESFSEAVYNLMLAYDKIIKQYGVNVLESEELDFVFKLIFDEDGSRCDYN